MGKNMVNANFAFGNIDESDPVLDARFKGREIAQRDGSFSMRIYLNGVEIAYAFAYPIDPEHYLIAALTVDKRLRGRKIGTYAVKFLQTHIRELAGRYLLAYCPLGMERFFLSLGFKDISLGEVSLDEFGQQSILMQKQCFKRRP